MSRSFVLVTIAGMACTAALQAQGPIRAGLSALDPSATQSPTFRSGVDLVSLGPIRGALSNDPLHQRQVAGHERGGGDGRQSRRNGRSVTPAIGASTTAGAIG